MEGNRNWKNEQTVHPMNFFEITQNDFLQPSLQSNNQYRKGFNRKKGTLLTSSSLLVNYVFYRLQSFILFSWTNKLYLFSPLNMYLYSYLVIIISHKTCHLNDRFYTWCSPFHFNCKYELIFSYNLKYKYIEDISIYMLNLKTDILRLYTDICF